LDEASAADAIDAAVKKVIASGLRTGDIWSEGMKKVGTSEMGDAVAVAISL
jgi:3-isopropylmalate dehydrogenase